MYLPFLTVLQSSSNLASPMPKLSVEWLLNLCRSRHTSFPGLLLLLIMTSISHPALWDCTDMSEKMVCSYALCISSPKYFHLLMQEYDIDLYQHDWIRGWGRKRRNCSIWSRTSFSRVCLCSQYFLSKFFSTYFWVKIFFIFCKSTI